MKKLIISADDFGYSKENNNAILSGVKSGIITATGIMPNMPGFNHAVEEVLPLIEIDLGLHFNIFEGKALTGASVLTDKEGNFNKGYIFMLLSQGNKKLLEAVRLELKAQLERVLEVRKISHIDSHCHYHSIPAIFDLFVKMAKEYDIKYVRTQKEPFYAAANKVFNPRFPANVIKHVLLNNLSEQNIKKARYENIGTNESFIGVLYTGYMDEKAILSGLKKIKSQTTEVVFHPYIPKNLADTNRLNNYIEFLITKNPKLKSQISEAGFELTSFAEL